MSTHMHIRLLLLTVFLTVYISASATIRRVTSLNDAGAGTLRSEIAAATAGDTVMMDVKGTINLQSVIVITKKLTILGAYAVHSTINGANVSGAGEGIWIQNISGSDTIVFMGFKFEGFDGSNALMFADNSNVRMLNCVFKNNIGVGAGMVVNTALGTFIEYINCSFVSNSAGANQGGCLFINAADACKVINCTFFQNGASDGGAIRNHGDLFVYHCTFLNNTATTGRDISNSSTGTVAIYNNIFSNPTPSQQFFDAAGVAWNNQGGNVFTAASGLFVPTIPFSPLDAYTGNANQAAVGLHATIVIDGYGLEYFPIIQQSSPAVDQGIISSPLPATDQRRAPRNLFGTSILRPDAGAVEYTPFRVTAPSGAGSFASVWNDMNVFGGNGGIEYMEFDLGANTTFSLGTMLSNVPSGIVRIIDGYTQHGTAVAGPRNPLSPGTYYTPAVIGITVSNIFDGVIHCQLWQTGSKISGLKIDNSVNNGILLTNCDIEIFGNIISTSGGSPNSGITVQGGNSSTIAVIGGNWYHQCNIISGYGAANSAGIFFVDKTAGKISGNLIGTTNNGLAPNGNFCGINLNTCSNIVVGGNRELPSRNVISCNTMDQVFDQAGDNNYYGNLIGTDISGEVALGGNGAHGIHFSNSTRGIIGSPVPGKGNLIVNQDVGIVADINCGNGGSIMGNYIGVTSTSLVIPNSTGITLVNNPTSGYNIGDGSPAGRNYIAGNTTMGVYVEGSHGNTFDGNYVGLKPDNTIAGNGSIGIHIVNGSDFNTVRNCVIVGHTGPAAAGIHMNSAGSDNMIALNKIGTNPTGVTAMPNETGIFIENQGLSNTVVTDNLISGNTAEGIQINSSFAQIIITNNIIGLNAAQTAAIPNTNGIVSYSSISWAAISNTLSGNNMRGIYAADCGDIYIRGNYIGTNPSGDPGLGNGDIGISLDFTNTGAYIGGVMSATDGNVIAYNGGAGIFVSHQSNQIGILSNSIYNNGSLGISLDNPSVFLPNDAGDADVSGVATGNVGNNGQNFPVNLTAAVCNGNTTINASLSTTAGNYLVDFFSITLPEVDGTGHGEGRTYLGSEFVTATVGNESFIHVYPGVLPVGSFVTATCSREVASFYETSEFSDTVRTTISVVANAGADVSTCAGSPASLSGAGSTGAIAVYSWYELPGLTLVDTGVVITVSPTVTTSYILNVYDGTCSHDDTVTVSIITPPNTTFTTGSASPYCANGLPVALTPVTSGGTFSGTGVIGNAFFPSTAGVGTHTIYYTLTTPCTITDSISVVVNPIPVIPSLVSSPPFEFCLNSPQSIQVTNTGGITIWYSNAALTNQIAIGNILPANSLASGNYNLYVVEVGGGCISQVFTISGVTMWGDSFINNNEPYNTCPNVPVQVNVSVPINATVQWDANAAISDTTINNPMITPDSVGVFPFTVTMGVSVSCLVSSFLSITIDACSIEDIPNAFSPDGDGVNDTWIIDAVYNNPNNIVMVYNRWGNVIKKFNGYNNTDNTWDGTFNGSLVPAGTYYYSVELPDINESRSGWVYITY